MRIALYLIFFAVPLTVAAKGRQAIAGAALSYSQPAQPLTLHQPVVLQFSVKNNTGQPLRLDLGQDRKGAYEFWVTPPNGTRVHLRQYQREGVSAVGQLSVEPGQTFSQSLVLNEWYRFRDPGAYVFEGRLTQPILVGDEAQRDPGFRFSIQIAPRDEASLAAACDSLANKIEESSGYEAAAQSALALSYVDDPLAVPYLRRALFARKLVERISIEGLERIGDDEAVRVLASAMNAGLPGFTPILARAALQRIEQQTPDPARKQAIKEMLQENTNH